MRVRVPPPAPFKYVMHNMISKLKEYFNFCNHKWKYTYKTEKWHNTYAGQPIPGTAFTKRIETKTCTICGKQKERRTVI